MAMTGIDMPEHQCAGTAIRFPCFTHISHDLAVGPAVQFLENFHAFLQGQIIERPGIHIKEHKKPLVIVCPGTDPAQCNKPFAGFFTIQMRQLIKVKVPVFDCRCEPLNIFGLTG